MKTKNEKSIEQEALETYAWKIICDKDKRNTNIGIISFGVLGSLLGILLFPYDVWIATVFILILGFLCGIIIFMTFSLPFVLFSSVARKKTKLIQKLSEEEKNQIIADAIEKQIKSCETNIPYCEQEIEKLQKDIQELQESIESEKKEIIELQKKMSML